MIGVKTDKGEVKLSPGTSLTIRLISPLFSKEVGDNSHTFNFALPGQSNQAIFGLYDSPLKSNPQTSIPGSLELANLEFSRGNLLVERGTGSMRKYNAKFDIDYSSYSEEINKTKLKDIDLGGSRDVSGLGSGSTLSLKLEALPSGYVASLKINDLTMGVTYSATVSLENTLDYFADQITQNNNLSKATATRTGTGASATLDITADPGEALNYDLNPPGNGHSWTVASQTTAANSTHASIIAHMTAVAQAANVDSYDYCFFPVHNPQLYGGLNPDYLGYLNAWDWDTNSFISNSTTSGEKWRNTAVPFPRLEYLINQICNHLGLVNISTFTQEAEFKKICLYNNVTLDLVRTEGGTEFNGFSNIINLSNHVPEDMVLGDVFEYLRSLNISVHIDSKNGTIDFVRGSGIRNNGKIDWRNKCHAAYSIKRTLAQEQGFRLYFEPDKSDDWFEIFSAAKQDFITGAGTTENPIPWPPTGSMTQPHPFTGPAEGWEIPALSQAGKTVFVSDDGQEVEAEEFIFRPFFYKGFETGQQTTKQYPWGTARNINFNGSNIGPWSLYNTVIPGLSDRGIWEEMFLPFYGDQFDRPEILQNVDLDLDDLLKINYFKIVRLRCEDGDFDGLIKQLDIVINMNRIEATRAYFQVI